MMKAMIRSSSDSETKVAMGMWDDIYAKNGMAFVEPHLRKPKVAPKVLAEKSEVSVEPTELAPVQADAAVEEEDIDTEDYTKTADLKKLFSAHAQPKDHLVVFEQLIGLSVPEFFE